MFGFTTFENWWETHSILRNIPRQQTRIARRLGREMNALAKKAKGIDEAFKQTPFSEKAFTKRYNAYAKDAAKCVEMLKKELTDYKTELNREIDRLEDIERQASTAKNPDQHVVQKTKEMMNLAEKNLEGFFRELTSFQNVNLSGQRLLDRASQIRELYYKLLQARKDDRRVKKELLRLAKDEHKDKASSDEKLADKASEDLARLLKEESDAIGIVLLLFQEIGKDVAEQKKKMMALTVPKKDGGEGYPVGDEKHWAKSHVAAIDKVAQEIDHFIIHEVSAGRIFLSKAERAQASVRLAT